MMKSFYTPARIFALVLLVLGLAPQYSLAQTVSVSPGDLSFGVPTGTLSPFASAPDNVLVNITGEGSRNFGATVVGSNAGDFVIDGNSCTGTLTAPSTCQVTLHFKASQAPLGTLETAALHISASGLDDFIVPMNGAYGAIKLFSALDVNNSLFPLSFPGQAVKTATLNLSCPAEGISAKLSSTPDGLSNIFQDNYIQVVNTAVGHDPTTTQNVCYGGDPNGWADGTLPPGTSNCFKFAYEGAAGGFIGQNPDLAGLPANYGVQPLDLQNPPSFGDSGPPFAPVLVPDAQALSVQLFDGGGLLGASTVHLVTNCTVAGVVPGSSITGDPIVPNVPQTFAFDTAPGQNISLSSTNTGTGAVPIVTNIGIPQSLFSQLVTGTSAAPAVCLRMTGEVDSFGQAMCKGFLLQCYDPIAKTTTGDNCVPTASDSRTLLDQAQFASPDAPPGVNYLYGPVGGPTPIDACSNVVPGGSCAPGTGPGMLLGSDNWLDGTTYSSGNCVLTGVLTNFLCPLDPLTQFKGAADPLSGSTTTGKNSIFIPVVNMPLPFTQTTITDATPAKAPLNNGWLNANTYATGFIATFTSNQASYPGGGSYPDENGFTNHIAPPYSVTYGLSNGLSVPDTTFPVAGDTTQYADDPNSPLAKHPSTDRLQPPPVTDNCTAKHPSFTATDSFPVTSDGLYNLHYFTTDCAFTEGLVFNPTTDQLINPTANWASFPVTVVGVDSALPIVAPPTFSAPGNTFNVGQNVSINYVCTDTGSGLATCPGQLPVPPACAPAPATGPFTFSSSSAIDTSSGQIGTHPSHTVTSTDCAGNISLPTPVPSYTIAAPPADLWLFEIPIASDSIKQGTTGSFYAGVINLSSPTAYNLVVTTTFSAPIGVLGSVKAGYALVTCKLTGCTTLPTSTPTPCAVSGTTITCTVAVPQLASVATAKYGVVVKVSIPVLGDAPLKAFTSVSTVTSANDPKSWNNSYTEHYTVYKK